MPLFSARTVQRAGFLVTTAAILAMAAPASADDEIVTPKPLQFDLYTQGAEAYKNGEYQKAIDLFEASLAIGELNITYLNLGRSFFKLGQCEKANEAYAKARTAPKIANPSPMAVLKKIDEFSAELPKECPAYLTVSCQPTDMQIYVGNQGPLQCDGKKITLLPGEHVVRGEVGDKKVSKTIQVEGMEKTTLALKLEGAVGGVVVDDDDKEDPDEDTIEDPTPVGNKRIDPGYSSLFILQTGLITSGGADIEVFGFSDDFDEDSTLALDFFLGWRITSLQLYIGPRLSFIPTLEFEGSGDAGVEIDASFGANMAFPIGSGRFAPYVEADVGLAAVLPSDDSDALTGSTFALGGGVRWGVTSKFALHAGLRFQNYSVSRDEGGGDVSVGGDTGRDFDDFGQEGLGVGNAEVALSGTRTIFNLGATLNF